MKKKVILITGGAKGIGASIAYEFSKNKYDIIINYNKSKNKAIKLKNDIERKHNTNVILIKADLRKENEIENLFNKVTKKYNKIDALINNAALSCDNYIEDKTKEEFMKVLETNVVAPFLLTKLFRNNVDTIINISSLDATITYNEISIDYCASKAALNSLTQTTSLALPNVKVYALMLPWINTETIKEMDPNYLENELKRTNQRKLIEPNLVAKKIFELFQNKSVKTGSVIRWDDIDG